jgi:MULE transposase domain
LKIIHCNFDFRAKIRRKDCSENTEVEILLNELKELQSRDPAAIIKTNVVDDIINIIYIQTGEMKQSFSYFPEVLLMDTTYSINNRRMPLVNFLSMDGYGNGIVVAYCFVADERQETIEAAVTMFAHCNVQPVQKTVTVVVDKDYGEIASIEKVLPRVHVHLCRFHVMKTFKSATIDEPKKFELRTLLNQMIYCTTAASYAKLHEKMAHLSTTSFLAYFDKNWHKCTQAWTNIDRVSKP